MGREGVLWEVSRWAERAMMLETIVPVWSQSCSVGFPL